MTYERRSGEALRLVLKEMVQPPSPNLPQRVLGQVRAAANPAFSSTSPRIYLAAAKKPAARRHGCHTPGVGTALPDPEEMAQRR